VKGERNLEIISYKKLSLNTSIWCNQTFCHFHLSLNYVYETLFGHIWDWIWGNSLLDSRYFVPIQNARIVLSRELHFHWNLKWHKNKLKNKSRIIWISFLRKLLWFVSIIQRNFSKLIWIIILRTSNWTGTVKEHRALNVVFLRSGRPLFKVFLWLKFSLIQIVRKKAKRMENFVSSSW